MTVTLTPHLEAIVRQKVDGGFYHTPDDVIAEALTLLDERDHHQRLLTALSAGEQGDGIPFTPELLDEIDREVDDRLRHGDEPSRDVRP